MAISPHLPQPGYGNRRLGADAGAADSSPDIAVFSYFVSAIVLRPIFPCFLGFIRQISPNSLDKQVSLIIVPHAGRDAL